MPAIRDPETGKFLGKTLERTTSPELVATVALELVRAAKADDSIRFDLLKELRAECELLETAPSFADSTGRRQAVYLTRSRQLGA